MANEASTAAEQGGGKSFLRELASAAAKKALTPVLAAAATAGTRYLTRKSTEIWQQDVLPKVREKGGGKAVAKETLEKVAGRLSGRYAQMISGVAERLGDGSESEAGRAHESSAAEASDAEPSQEQEGATESDEQREEERRQRQKRRQQRQKALQKSAST